MPLLLRLLVLSSQSHRTLIQRGRFASASSSSAYPAASSSDGGRERFPFPTHPRPTPYQIFHLPHSASQKEIKARYYDLVRAHHPDSFHCRKLSPEERHSRFQAIATAYDSLRGNTKFNAGWRERGPNSGEFDPLSAELLRRRNAYYAHPSRQPGYEEQRAKDAWASESVYDTKDRMIILFGALLLIAGTGVVPGIFSLPSDFDRSHKAAAASLKQARNDAQEFGDARMVQVRRRVQEIKSQTS